MGLQSANNSLGNFSLGLYKGSSGISPANSLLIDLVSFYRLEEAANSLRMDSGPALYNLTNTADVLQGVGVIDKGADFRGSPAKLTHTFESEYDLSDTDFAFTGWMNLDAAVSAHTIYLGRGGTGNLDRIVSLLYLAGGNEMRFVISNNGVTTNLLAGDIGGGIPIGSYFFFCVSYNKTTKLMSMSLNGQTPTTLVSAGNPQTFGTESFLLGSSVSNQNPLVGRIDLVGFWRREITMEECDFLYNSGAGNIPNLANFVYNDDGVRLTNDDGAFITT